MGGRRFVLGVDGGGTQTTAWLAEVDGVIVGRGSAGASNVKAVKAAAAMHALETSIQRAFVDAEIEIGPVAASCFGLAGWDRIDDQERLRAWAATQTWARELVLVNDGDLVVAAGAAEGWGVGVVSGTGSIAVGRTRDGRTARAGGWGYIFGDEGSGFAVAVAGLRKVARRYDGREPAVVDDPLTHAICESLNVAGPADLIRAIHGERFDRARVASLARAVVAAAEIDASIAREILEPAGFDLAAQAKAVAAKLGLDSGDLPLAMAGGLLRNSPVVARALIARLEGDGYRVNPRVVENPVEGAIALARRALGE